MILHIVYRHPVIDLEEFNDKYVNALLDTKESKTFFIRII